jgi:hypothetical protein
MFPTAEKPSFLYRHVFVDKKRDFNPNCHQNSFIEIFKYLN